MLGISLYSYLYPKLAKMIHLSYYLLGFLFNKIREEGRTGSAWKRGLGEGEDSTAQWRMKGLVWLQYKKPNVGYNGGNVV
jgi:hypothetical protein